MPGCSWRGHLRGVHIHYCPGVLGGDTCEGYIFITARVFLEGTPAMCTYGFHYCPGVLGGDTYDGSFSTSSILRVSVSELDAWLTWCALESKLTKFHSWISTYIQMIRSRCIAFKIFIVMQLWDKCYTNFKKINEITFQTTHLEVVPLYLVQLYYKWKKAINEEIVSLEKNQTWSFVRLPAGKKALQSKWVFRVKEEQDGKKRYKKQGVDYNEIFSPIVKMTTIKLVISIVIIEDLRLEKLDVKTVFLDGDLNEDIYMA
ncbi:putative RNA-directed DNA polymerase [Tanacetum coccineum]